MRLFYQQVKSIAFLISMRSSTFYKKYIMNYDVKYFENSYDAGSNEKAGRSTDVTWKYKHIMTIQNSNKKSQAA